MPRPDSNALVHGKRGGKLIRSQSLASLPPTRGLAGQVLHVTGSRRASRKSAQPTKANTFEVDLGDEQFSSTQQIEGVKNGGRVRCCQQLLWVLPQACLGHDTYCPCWSRVSRNLPVHQLGSHTPTVTTMDACCRKCSQAAEEGSYEQAKAVQAPASTAGEDRSITVYMQ